jgi:hypothetical protein
MAGRSLIDIACFSLVHGRVTLGRICRPYG